MALMLTLLFLHNSKSHKKLTQFGLLASLLLVMTMTQLAWSQPYERSVILDEAIAFETLAHADGQMHYAYAGNEDKPGILFVHGTPGGWGAFEVYLENEALRKDFFMISVDRLGWGQSTLTEGQHLDGDFTPQSQGIIQIMQAYPAKKWVIVGHSLGASLAPKIALEAPERVAGLLLLAGSLDPKLGKPRWYNRLASTWVVSKLIGEIMSNSNREIMGLRQQLKTMSKTIKHNKLDVKLSVIQGLKDKLVSPKNSTYVDKNWRGHFATIEIIELQDEGHFLPWRQTPLVIDTIRSISK